MVKSVNVPVRRRPRTLTALVGTVLAGATVLAQPASAVPADAPLRHLASARQVVVGAAVAAGPLANDATYREIVAREFSAVTPENALKWESVEPRRGEYTWDEADTIVKAAVSRGQKVRGHTLIWHSQMPSWLSRGNFSDAEVRTIAEQHISTTMKRYRGRIDYWDVVNEPFNEDGTYRDSFWRRKLGPDYVAQSLIQARKADPHAKLYLNDYNIEGINAKSDAMYELVRSLKERGVPIDGVGFQAHFVLGGVPATFQANLERFAALGVDVAVTELDVRMQLPATPEKLALQARDYQQVMDACLAVSRCTGVTVWGVTDKYSWVPGWFAGYGAALPYDEQYNPKPAYAAMWTSLADRKNRL